MNVRDKLPVRRTNPTKDPSGKNWSEHKPDLKEDFHSHCGYCGSFDGFRHTYFEVDHFIPKSLFEKNENIAYCHYPNLVYSCKFCNNNKLSKWPTKDESIPNKDNKGFVDPCSPEYDSHLYRTKDGGILWKTDLGKWMVQEAFKFDERAGGIKILWELNKLRKAIERITIEQKSYDENSDEYKKIKEVARNYSFKYVEVHRELMDYYNNL